MLASNTDIRFDDQVVVITGAGRGLGRSYALEFARRGATLLVNDVGGSEAGGVLDADPAAEVAAAVVALGGQAVSSRHDASTDADAIVALAKAQFGRIDVLVNNAGISGGAPIWEIESETFQRMLQVHVISTFEMTKHAWPLLEASRGRVINTSSTSVFGLPSSAHYVTAKAAIFGLTRAAALEGIPFGIRVNAIMPTAYTRLTAQIEEPAFRDLLEQQFPPDLVAPFVAYLGSESLPCSGETFAIGAGNIARVVLATYASATTDSPTAEYFAELLPAMLELPGDELSDLGIEVPADTIAEVGRVLNEIQHRFGSEGLPTAPTTFGGE